jgi:hypothetical protein
MGKLASRSLFAPFLGAALLYVFNVGFDAFAAVVIPYLLELMEKSVRLAALGWLALLTSPIACIALIHRAAHGVMDRLGSQPERGSTGMASVRAGTFGWSAMWLSSMTSGLLLLALFPPEEDRGLAAFLRLALDVRLEMGVHALLWIAAAATLFHIDRAGGRSGQS